MTRRLWTAEDLKTLCRMKAEKSLVRDIALALGRSEGAVVEQWRWINNSEERRERRRDRTNLIRSAKRNGTPISHPHKVLGYSTISSRPSGDLLADAQRRMLAPRTIGQEIFGDPPPGYSALDRKRQGAAP